MLSDDAFWSLEVSGHVFLSAAWCEVVVLGRGRDPALERGLSSSSAPPAVSMAAAVGWLPPCSLREAVPRAEGREDELRSVTLPGCSTVPPLLEGALMLRLSCWIQHKPLVMAAFSACRDPRRPCTPMLQPASIQQISAAQASP